MVLKLSSAANAEVLIRIHPNALQKNQINIWIREPDTYSLYVWNIKTQLML